MDQIDLIKKIIKESKSYSDLYDLSWKIYSSSKIEIKHSDNITIGYLMFHVVDLAM